MTTLFATPARRQPARRNHGLHTRAATDQYGRLSVEGAAYRVTARKMRKLTNLRGRFVHRTKNGINDPYSFFHLVDALLNIEPNQPFTTKDLTDWLNDERPSLTWDVVTVGRILNDLRETFADLDNREEAQPIHTKRDWKGSIYWTSNQPLAQTQLWRVLEDLIPLGTALEKEEAEGKPPKRPSSPLGQCASVMDIAERV